VATVGIAFVEEYLWLLAGLVILAGAAMIFGSRIIRSVSRSTRHQQ